MPNNTRTEPDGTWVDDYAVPDTDWEDLERKIHGSWNGDRGGAYCAPATGGDAYVFGASGLQVTGPTRLTAGGVLIGPAGAFKIRDGAWPLLAAGHSGRTRSIVQVISSYMAVQPHLWTTNHDFGGVGSVALSARHTFGRTLEEPEIYVPLRVVDGSTITQVELNFRVAQKRITAPVAMPKVRILRVPLDPFTNKPQPLKGTADGSGFASPTKVTSPAAWYLEGAPQSFVYTCDQNNVIDISAYSYVAHIVEEKGTFNPDEAFDGIRVVERKTDVTFAGDPGSFSLNGVVAIDGCPVGDDATRILIVDSDDRLNAGTSNNASVRNGIWLKSPGDWTRAADLDEPSDFTPNWIVRVAYGLANIHSVWQCEWPSATSKISLSVDPAIVPNPAGTQPRIVPAKPRGNIYHSLVPTFAVADTRFQ